MRLSTTLLFLACTIRLAAQQPSAPVADTCVLTPLLNPAAGADVFQLPDSLGTLQLGPGTVARPLGHNPHGREYVLEDSTVIEVWVTPEPATGSLMSTGPVTVSASTLCRTTIQSHRAVVSKVALTKPGGTTPSVYVGAASITLGSTSTINIAVTTATASSRDQALRLVTLLNLRARAH
jgi:hypothetical protein